MPIELKIIADGAALLRDDVLALAGFMRADDAPVGVPQPNAPDNPVQPPAEMPAAEAPKRRGRPPKAEAKPVIAQEADDTPVPFAAEKEPAPKPVKTDVQYGPEASREALHALVETSGLDAGKRLLGEFGAARIGDLKPEQHKEFYERCKAEVVG